jgi:hypothetical protein
VRITFCGIVPILCLTLEVHLPIGKECFVVFLPFICKPKIGMEDEDNDVAAIVMASGAEQPEIYAHDCPPEICVELTGMFFLFIWLW